jgi:hypothetical protein
MTGIIGRNNLFPVFFKLEEMQLLIVGGGNVALEKLHAVLNNSPRTKIRLVAKNILPGIFELAKVYRNLQPEERAFREEDLSAVNLVIVAVNDLEVSGEIVHHAKKRNLLVNVADKPALCDFYLAGIVQKGNLKIAVSTNGKSPTFAKRLKELLLDVIPDEVEISIEKLNELRSLLKGSFREKVERLNAATQLLIDKTNEADKINL